MFQVAAGFEIAKKNNRFLVLVYRSDGMTHNKSLTEFLSTIFSEFNYISWDDMNFDNVIRMHEDKCFDYYGSNFESSDYDYYFNGYFQNKKYLNTYRQELLDIFCGYRDEYLQKKSIFMHHSRMYISYFIHIRRGDYVGHPLYILDLDQYLKLAISYILEINQEQIPHFYILSDDITFCKTYSILDTIEKTIIEDMDTLDSFYFMSLCRKGGICANSTFSGWASMLNDNPDKTVIVPKNWINVVYPYEIPFDYTISF